MAHWSWFWILAVGCGSSTGLNGPVLPERPELQVTAPTSSQSDLNSTATLDERSRWSELASRPENAVFARTEVVKFVIDLEDDRALYFLNTNRWPIHYDFANRFLREGGRTVVDHATFNVREYQSDERRFVLGSVVHYLGGDQWTFEMVAGDTLPAAQVLAAFDQVQAAVFFGSQLRYRPLSDNHEAIAEELAERIPTISTEDALGGARYQPLTTGTAYGYIRIVEGDLARAQARPNDILVTQGVPQDLPICSALITASLQAPLAHVAVLSQNRGTPNMGLRGAIADDRISAFADQLVKITVGPQDFTITSAALSEAEAHWQQLRPAAGFTPPADYSRSGLIPLCSVRVRDAMVVGAKAAQLGELCSLQPRVQTPGGFVIPFHYYNAHLGSHGLRPGINQMILDRSFASDRQQREQRLAQLRHVVENTDVDPQLVRQVHARLRRSPNRFIFRSSTNAEDLPGFNGAGLYRSVVVGPRPSVAEVETAIRQVWASVWTLRGYEEREWYRINQRTVAMGVLVQPFVPNIVATGVAITRNPFNARRPGVFINIQVEAGSVTDAGSDVPEQQLVYSYRDPPTPEVLSRSSLTNGAPILNDEEAIQLSQILNQIHARLADPDDPRRDAIDVEFVVNERREFIIVQARPYPR